MVESFEPNPLEMPQVGYLKKKSSKINQWRDRYFILDGCKLSYYVKKSDKDPKVTLLLTRDCLVSEVRCDVTKYTKLFVFRIIWQLAIPNVSSKEDSSLLSKANIALLFCGIIAGAFTSGLGMLVCMIMLGGLAYNHQYYPTDSAAYQDSTRNDSEKSVLLACDSYEEAEIWVQAIEDQIYCLRTGQSLSAARAAASLTVSPSTDSRISGMEEWIRGAKWKPFSIEDGVRVCALESTRLESTSNLPSLTYANDIDSCLRIDVGVTGLPIDVLSTILQMPSPCCSGHISSVRVVEIIDTFTEIIHVILHPIFVFPTWTAPRDFCLRRCWKESIDGSYIICLDSTIHHDCPLLPEHIRGELHAAYMICPSKDGDADEDNGQCLLTLVAKMNPFGWTNTFSSFQNKYIRQFLLHVLDIRDFMDADRFIQANLETPLIQRKPAPMTVTGSTANAEKSEPEGSIATIPPPLLSPEVWADINASSFKVRGPTYNVDKVKTVSAPALFKLIGIDLYEVPEPTQNVCAHPRNRVNMALQRGEKSWVFVMNIMIPGPPFLCFVVYMQGDPELLEQDTPFGRIAKRFFHGNDDEFRNNRFKLIPKIIDGNMIVKMAVKDTPALLGNKLKQYYHKGDNYFEVDIDVGSSSIARNVVGLAIGYSKAIVVDMGICLQGDEENELPEVIIGGCSCIHVDMSKSKKL